MLLLVGLLGACASAPNRSQPVAQQTPQSKPKPVHAPTPVEEQQPDEPDEPDGAEPELTAHSEARVKEPSYEQPESTGTAVEGGEIDIMRSRAIGMYRTRLVMWLQKPFTPPALACARLKQLKTGVKAELDDEQVLTGYTLTHPSGSKAFDDEVRAALSSLVGQQGPPAPPRYPELAPRQLHLTFAGRSAKC